jgi:probable O-glycosylation ligase (exosortase A-associated)
MRDLAFALLMAGLLPVTIARPLIGLMVYLVLSVASPHRLMFGFAYDFPWAQIVAIPLILSVLLRPEYSLLRQLKKWFVPLLLLTWTAISTLAAFSQDVAIEKLNAFFKIQLGCLLILAMIKTREEIRLLIAVIACSVGFYGVKGALFMVATGAEWRVSGPPESTIGDNNHLALALVVVVPLLAWLFMTATKKWLRIGFLGALLGTLFSALGSYSRGGFLGLGAVLILYLARSGNAIKYGAILLPIAAGGLAFMPDKFWDRMNSIGEYQSDNSSLERLNTWEAMYNIANSNVFGGGFAAYTSPTSVLPYAPSLEFPVRAAHSVYFQILGDHGWVGLLLFVICILIALFQLQRIIGRAKRAGDSETKQLGYAMQASIFAYCISGTFLSMAYWEGFWYLMATVVSLKTWQVNGQAQKIESGSSKPEHPLSPGLAHQHR